jgi:thioredoxin reductase (NADPH)
MTNGKYYDVLIIGSGPAGWTAAVYASRANLKVLLFTGLLAGGTPGGQLMLTTEVENYPGFADGVIGPELMDQMRRQALRFGTELVEDDVTRVDFSRRPLTAYIGEGDYEEAYHGKAVIIATGASAIWLGLDSEERLRGRGVSSCATCDGFFFRGKEIAVIGGGDTAMEEATYLTQHASKVTVVHRRDQLRASKIMQERAFKNPKIDFAWNSEVKEIVGENGVEGLRLRDAVTGEEKTLPVQGVFVAIGHRPNTELFRGQIDMDDAGYIVAKEHTATNVPGVFVAGDVRDHRYRQAVTAAGEGCMAALDAQEYITGEIWTDWAIGEQSPVVVEA